MNKILSILTVTVFVSCNSVSDQKLTDKSDLVKDTIVITQKLIDTIYIEKSVNQSIEMTEFYIQERLPEWFLSTGLLEGLKFQENYVFDNRLNPLYLEEDFNGDGFIDIAIPISQEKSGYEGFAIIHGKSEDVYIIGAGTLIKKGLSDDMSYIDIWKINRQKKLGPGLDENGDLDKDGTLILQNPSLQIEKSEVGGGQIYWDGKEYVYFHETC